jgi:2,4-dienoyl-CoA reductase-like NADH-dependent reductase (Old Yellow Enzyme family)
MAASSSQLFSPIQVGAAALKHRVVLAPLTRMRSDFKTAVPPELAIEYYAQRASGKSSTWRLNFS